MLALKGSLTNLTFIILWHVSDKTVLGLFSTNLSVIVCTNQSYLLTCKFAQQTKYLLHINYLHGYKQ